MAVGVAPAVGGGHPARRGRLGGLADGHIQREGHLVLKVKCLEGLGRAAQDAAGVGVHQHPAAVQKGHPFALFVPGFGDALEHRPFALLRHGDKGQHLAAPGHPVHLQGLLCQQEHRVVLPVKVVVHADGLALIGGDLLRQTQERPRRQPVVHVTVAVHHPELLGIKLGLGHGANASFSSEYRPGQGRAANCSGLKCIIPYFQKSNKRG